MISKEITIMNKLGLHARAAAKFVAIASRFTCDIQVSKNGRTVNGKSIMGVMMLAANQGSTITLEINGLNEHEALVEIETLVNNRFDEAE